ncbi:MAG: nicotinate-nucleotide adenylyltransferase [Flavobacteriaceae bacterium]|nr:nicotinate-nucleotide adenylyltransferase [Flavobacteriaceae bacterium]
MRKLVMGLLLIGMTAQSFSQSSENFKTIELDEVNIIALNSTYVNRVIDKNSAAPVQHLERKAAAFDITVSDLFSEEFDTYEVNFENQFGRITATYDVDGEIMRSYEKFKDVKVPSAVSKSIASKFPGWHTSNTTYLVNYKHDGNLSRVYKVSLEKGKERLNIKTDEKGNFL